MSVNDYLTSTHVALQKKLAHETQAKIATYQKAYIEKEAALSTLNQCKKLTEKKLRAYFPPIIVYKEDTYELREVQTSGHLLRFIRYFCIETGDRIHITNPKHIYLEHEHTMLTHHDICRKFAGLDALFIEKSSE